ncbi:MAG: choice-of-anchor D domain-containing protein [Steroidobacteraceae bacterium]
MTVTNSGTASLTFTGIAVTGDFAIPASGTTCSTSAPVAASSNCVINVTFSPMAAGTLSGTLTITDNNNGVAGSMQTVSLSGTGTGPVVSLSAPPTFSSEPVGTTSPAQTVTVTNTGSANLTFTAPVAVSGPFAIATSGTTCSTSRPVAVSGSCMVAVTFTPTAGGPATGTLSFTDNAGGSPQTLALSATGQDFALAVPSGSSSSQTVSPGATATYTIAATSLGGFNQSVSLSCSGTPSEATCQLSQPSVTPSSSGANITVTVATCLV